MYIHKKEHRYHIPKSIVFPLRLCKDTIGLERDDMDVFLQLVCVQLVGFQMVGFQIVGLYFQQLYGIFYPEK